MGAKSILKAGRRGENIKLGLPSIIMGNVRSLTNKMDEWGALVKIQWEYNCNLELFQTLTLPSLAFRLFKLTETEGRVGLFPRH